MATASTPPTRGRRRALDATVNLVPFIDLLSCCLAFLLITAAWSQLARIEASTAGASDALETQAPPPAVLTVHRDGYSLRSAAGSERSATDAELAAALTAIHTTDDLELHADDDVRQDRLVSAIDHARTAGFSRVALRTDG